MLFYRCLPLALLVIMLQHRQLLRRCYKIPTNYIHPQNFTKVTKFTVMNNYPCMAVWFAICIKLVKNLNMCNLKSLCLHNQSNRQQPDYIQSQNVKKCRTSNYPILFSQLQSAACLSHPILSLHHRHKSANETSNKQAFNNHGS